MDKTADSVTPEIKSPLEWEFGKASPEIFKALIEAQKEMKPAEKNAENPHFKSSYADLAAVYQAGLPLLNKAGLCVIQIPSSRGKIVKLTTILGHTSGQYLSSCLYLEASDARPQAIGSAITYGRRYSFGSLIALATEEDDDGNAASDKKKQQAPPPQSRQAATPPAKPPAQKSTRGEVNDAQIKRLFTVASKHNWTTEHVKEFLKVNYKLDSTRDLKKDEYDAIVHFIETGDG